jgi:spore coat protein CotF
MEPQALTTKELGFVEECVKSEVLCAEKLRCYEREAQDPELREICRHGIQACERHIDELLSLLR